MTMLLDVQEIHTSYGHSRALFGVSIEVRQGECVCLLGRNGVGKSTTMRSIMGLTPPSSGGSFGRARISRAAGRFRSPEVESVSCPKIAGCLPT